MHKMVYGLDIVNVPRIIEYNYNTGDMMMEHLRELSISDMYGENFEDVPPYIIQEIRNIIKVLVNNGIYYPDITGYNFIEYEGKLWIIDFEHASFTHDDFVEEFISGRNSWNPEFR
jgi:tRNA A-37 threonylcarbamoyl transferase component Bud32